MSFVLVLMVIGQCQNPCQIVCPQEFVVYEKIYLSEEVKSKFYVPATLTNGQKIYIPIINGYVPAVRVKNDLREFDYSHKEIYEGGTVKYYNPKNIITAPRIVSPRIVSPVKPIEAPVKPIEAPVKPIEAPVKPIEAPKVFLKKPSDFGK